MAADPKSAKPFDAFSTATHDGPAPDTPSRLRLLLWKEQHATSHVLPEVGTVTLGRSSEASIPVEDLSVSRQHARITLSPLGMRIEDLGSANGTRVREQWLTPGQPVSLSLGEVVDLGAIWIMVLRGAATGARPRSLRSHDYFEGRLEDECARAARAQTVFTVARIHVARLPAEVIQEVLGRSVRAADAIARYGPGEFEILFVDAPGPDAAAVLDRIALDLGRRGGQVSVGQASYPADGRAPEALFAMACAKVRGLAGSEPGADAFVAVDPATQAVASLCDRIADSDISVILFGETGVGKEIFARRIHQRSSRAPKPFLGLNCAAFTESLLESELFGHERGAFTGAVAQKPGLLESAQGGTILLDELGEMPPSIQVKLLRVLEAREVLRVGGVKPRPIDVRILAATNRDLEAAVVAGSFRGDLFFRLNGISLSIPPLRERPADIEPLVRRLAPEITPAALALLRRYHWPGNIRELRNLIERALLLSGGGQIDLAHLPVEKLEGAFTLPRPVAFQTGRHAAAGAGVERPEVTQRVPIDRITETSRPGAEATELERIVAALERCGGNQTRAAKMLGISRRTLSTKLGAYNLPRPRKGAPGDHGGAQ